MLRRCETSEKKEAEDSTKYSNIRTLASGGIGFSLDAINSINLHANMDQYWIDWKLTEIYPVSVTFVSHKGA